MSVTPSRYGLPRACYNRSIMRRAIKWPKALPRSFGPYGNCAINFCAKSSTTRLLTLVASGHPLRDQALSCGSNVRWQGSVSHGFASSACLSATNGDCKNAEHCWNCQAREGTSDAMFCPSCGVIRPINQKITYHSMMQLKNGSYAIDLEHLERRYKDLQKVLHPDKFSMKSETEKTLSAEASSFVNEAFSTLKNPLRRSEYLLRLQGIEATEEVIEDPELLMTIMTAREAIEEADDENELRRFYAEFDHKSSICNEALAEAFQQGNLAAAQKHVALLRYLTNILAAIQHRL